MPPTCAAPAPWVTTNVASVTEAGAIASLKVAVTLALMGTPLAPLAGFVPLTVGAVVSAFTVTLRTTVALPAELVAVTV